MAVTLYNIDKLLHALQIELDTNDDSKDNANIIINSTQSTTENEMDDITIDCIKRLSHDFVEERDWQKFHTPRNLLCALVGEIGELSEIFQWRGEVKRGLPEFSSADKTHLNEEMADCLIYLCRLAEVCNVNLKHAVIDKMAKNRKKYPSHLVKGSSKKYTHYIQNNEKK